MSIAAKIAALAGAGKLWPYKPRTRQPPRRRLYLTAEARADLDDPASAVNSLVGRGYIEGALTRWASGDRIYGEKTRCRFLCRLRPPPPEIWDIRVTEPLVHARLFGRFAEPDTLVLTKFHTRRMLGKKGSSSWLAAMNECEGAWRRLFGAEVYVGATIHDYVTENCDDFPI